MQSDGNSKVCHEMGRGGDAALSESFSLALVLGAGRIGIWNSGAVEIPVGRGAEVTL